MFFFQQYFRDSKGFRNTTSQLVVTSSFRNSKVSQKLDYCLSSQKHSRKHINDELCDSRSNRPLDHVRLTFMNSEYFSNILFHSEAKQIESPVQVPGCLFIFFDPHTWILSDGSAGERRAAMGGGGYESPGTPCRSIRRGSERNS